MNMAAIDWVIFLAVYAGLVGGVVMTKRYMQSVADFLAAGRTAGRYMLSVAAGMAGLGAISVVGFFEMGYEAGFTMAWWGQSMGIVILAVTASGWVAYRFRQTRCLTLPEFFERRYSRNFRVFAGVVAYVAGLINFGIFPAVGARFFMAFMGLPDTIPGTPIPVFPCLMAVLLSTALYFVYSGGQVAVMITDFVQGLFANIIFVIVPLYLLGEIGWDRAVESFVDRPEGKSFLDAFETSKIPDFNFWFFLIGVVGFMYSRMGWQGEQAYNTSAKSAHEAKMGGMLAGWRGIPQGLLLTLVPALCYVVLNHPDFADLATTVQGSIDGIVARIADPENATEADTMRNQLRVPVTLAALLPAGLLGAFAAVMLGLFISTHDTYLHSWGSMFVQDVIMPFRKKPYTKEEHIKVLRRSILGVALFIFFFSWFVGQTQQIMLFFAVTGAIFAGGSGAVIIGGLYWPRGTARGAWLALGGGALIAVSGVVLPHVYELLDWGKFPINGQIMWAISMGVSCILYVVGSLTDDPPDQDLDKVLHRGEHAIAGEKVIEDADLAFGWRALGITPEFSVRDKVLYAVTYAWTGLWVGAFAIGTIWSLGFGHTVDIADWAVYWKWYFLVQAGASLIVIVWFTVGGLNDAREMIARLSSMERDEADDGMVRHDET
jgi:SSS family solute:Na+ symporter